MLLYYIHKWYNEMNKDNFHKSGVCENVIFLLELDKQNARIAVAMGFALTKRPN